MVRYESTRCRRREFPAVLVEWLVRNEGPPDLFGNWLENEVCLPENCRHFDLLILIVMLPVQ